MHCITCKISITDISHYETEHHIFNIKRKLHDFPIISLTEFQKFEGTPNYENTQNPRENNTKLNINEEKVYYSCDICGKNFKKTKPLENHIKSHFNSPSTDIFSETHGLNNEYNLNLNILTDGEHLFLENSKVLGNKKSTNFYNKNYMNIRKDKLVIRENNMPFELPRPIGMFPDSEKVNNKLDKAKYIVRRFD
ncbi:Zinc finger protein [Cucumispora dikerogammari]|nr:Zinc finger protein [Cucumispora dikerogammari]